MLQLPNLEAIAPDMLAEMKEQSFSLQREINKTPKWRKIKRYLLLEKLYKLDEDRGLIAHVFEMEDKY